jgi:hypothetical protein
MSLSLLPYGVGGVVAVDPAAVGAAFGGPGGAFGWAVGGLAALGAADAPA